MQQTSAHQTTSRFTVTGLYCMVLGMCLAWLHPVAGSAAGGPSADGAAQQSTDALSFELVSARLQTLMTRYAAGDSIPADIRENQKEAERWAAQGDYELALTYLDNALAFFAAGKAPLPAAMPPLPTTAAWSIELFAGSDLWQQRFGLSLTDKDSSIHESRGNPFSGLRAGYHDQHNPVRPLRAQVEARFSEQYVSGLAEFTHSRPLAGSLAGSLSNRTEGTRYRQQRELTFWQNWSQAHFSWQAGANTRLLLADDWQWRRYAEPTSYLSSFSQNQIGVRLIRQWQAVRPELRYDYRVRSYDSDERCDYKESLFTLYLWPDLFKPLQLTALLQSRRRHYSGTFVDSLLNNHFQEFYGQADSKWSIHPAWILRTELEFNLRRYEFPAIATPHYYDVTVEPSLAWQATATLSIRTGFRWRQKRHWFSQSGDDWNAEMENFNGYGPVLGCDVLTTKGLYLSLLEHFEWRRYPQAPAYGFSLYSDRHINSLFLLAGWSISHRWELSAMATIDHDDDRNVQGADSRSDILNFELYYKF